MRRGHETRQTRANRGQLFRCRLMAAPVSYSAGRSADSQWARWAFTNAGQGGSDYRTHHVCLQTRVPHGRALDGQKLGQARYPRIVWS